MGEYEGWVGWADAGAWVIHVVLIVLAKLVINEIPGVSDSVKWTIVNLGYMAVRAKLTHAGIVHHVPFCARHTF